MKTLYLLIASVSLVSCSRIVKTNNGPIKGISVAEGKVEAYLGIPYAEPPVGLLRFAKPVPKSTWEDTLETNKLPPYCVQAKYTNTHFPIEQLGEMTMSEDCLFLNMWVPKGGSSQKPIMLFIHGGGYMVGSSAVKTYDGTNLSKRGDVIVVTINYRVGTMGFFSAFNDGAAGNMGMYDQVMAIQWIKDNARHFGGDPDNIVLFGESAGSFSVSLHMISPVSKNLFKRGILQSGSVFHSMYSEGNEELVFGSQTIARMAGCLDEHALLMDNQKSTVECLKNLPAERISEVDLRFFKSHGWLIPRVGDEFLPSTPVNLYRQGDFKDDEVLIGITQDEGSIFFTMMNFSQYGLYGEKVDASSFNETQATEFLKSVAGKFSTSVADQIVQSYLDRVKEASRYTYAQTVADYLGDSVISCGAVFQADFQSLKNTAVYFYLFDYRPASSPLAEWMGVAHFDEVQYVFGNPMYANFTEFEEEFSQDVMDMWIAFVKTGNPSITKGISWPRYTYDDPKYYVIGKTDRVGVKPDNNRCETWRPVYGAVVDEESRKNLQNL